MLWSIFVEEEAQRDLREAFLESVLNAFEEYCEQEGTVVAECCFGILRQNIMNGSGETVQKEMVALFLERTSSRDHFYLEGDVYARFLDLVKEKFLTTSVRHMLDTSVHSWEERLKEIFGAFLHCTRLHHPTS